MNPRIVLSPFSSRPVRDWPIAHFRDLAVLCVERLDASVDFVGSAQQRHGVNLIIRTLPADRYRNHCGRLTWKETGTLIQSAAYVVSNNSGIGHYAADLGIPVACIFAATHSPLVWMPRGPHVSVMIRQTACSPCGISQVPADCPHALRCLGAIAPEDVFGEICRILAPLDKGRDTAPANAGSRSGHGSDAAGAL